MAKIFKKIKPYSITQNGYPLDKSLYFIDEEKRIFETNQGSLVLDFGYEGEWSFKTGNHCVFNASHSCNFKTGSHCSFKVTSNCTFTTGESCMFWTCERCTFITGDTCTFSIRDIATQSFEIVMPKKKRWRSQGYYPSIILDRKDGERYLLDEDFLKLLRVIKG